MKHVRVSDASHRAITEIARWWTSRRGITTAAEVTDTAMQAMVEDVLDRDLEIPDAVRQRLEVTLKELKGD